MKTYLSSINGKRRVNDLKWNSDALINDLGLKPVFSAMSEGNNFLTKNSMEFVLTGCNSIEEILYRQEILRDFIANRGLAGELYRNAVEFTEYAKKQIFWFSNNESLSIEVSVDILRKFIIHASRLRAVLSESKNSFNSIGLKKFYSVISQDFGPEYLDRALEYLEKLNFHDGVTLSMALGPGNSGRDYILHEPDNSISVKKTMKGVLERHFTYTLHERDIGGAEEIKGIKSRGMGKVAAVLRIAAKNVMEFYDDIKREAGFYLAAINLMENIEKRKAKICFPEPCHNKCMSFTGLYDLGLLLSTGAAVVPNNMESLDTGLFIITGTNRGGKSTFLRSIGQAQILMQAGIFVPSEYYGANIVSGIYTHFKSGEDRNLNRGKFEDELSKMDEIVKHLTRNGMVLFNESFSSTNTREGSEIALDITRALLENGIMVFFVSHLYEFASAVASDIREKSLFLVAERTEDGKHTYRIIRGKPQETGHGMDLYRKIFVEQNANTGNLQGRNE
ncbi:MAG: hypothetical protein RE471_09270 [Ferroplasma sp.]|uniref:MutS-related protein n=1 Tax=Ferroplasma sp. TaxID=2591003 RepID=UPI0028155337|nr:hypothetical protein [Ferroplasma sp.]WMT51154.1 MAG: hypothetical protein RE471_09270 [Ferroplasma sp.]